MYVCWIDMMGTQSNLQRSLIQSAAKLFPLHVATMRAREHIYSNMYLYTVMDGVFAVTPSKGAIIEFMDRIFVQLAGHVVDKIDTSSRPFHTPIPRAALAYGPIIHGSDTPEEVSHEIAEDDFPKDELLVGLPMVHAYINEREAPPFGIYVHETARTFAPRDETGEGHQEPLKYIWYEWFRDGSNIIYESSGDNLMNSIELAKRLSNCLEDYYKYCLSTYHRIPHYSPSKMKEHISRTAQYFPEFDDTNIT